MNRFNKPVPNSVVTIVFIVIICLTFWYVHVEQKQLLQGSSLTLEYQSSPVAEVKAPINGTSGIPKTISTSTWEIFSSMELGYSILYPSEVKIVDTGDPISLTFAFPKTYFSTDMKDDVSVSVYAAPTCEPIAISGGANGEVSENVMVSGINFLRNEQNDVAVGNRYHSVTYDVMRNKVCYRITYFVHGANGAGLYVSEPAEVKAMQTTHDAELTYVTKVFEAMLSSFSFLDTPAGNNEVTGMPATSPSQGNTLYFKTRK